MRPLLAISTGLVVALSALAAPAHAQSKAQWRACRSGDLDSRIAACTRIIKRTSRKSRRNRASAYTSRAYIYNEKGQYDRAIRDLDAAIRLDSKNASAFNNRGYAYSGKGDFDSAIRDYSKAIRLRRKFSVAYANRGRAYQKKRDHEKALRDFNQAIRIDPKNPINYNSRGNVYFNKGDYDRSIRDYDKAIRLNPKNPINYNSRGNAYFSKGDYDRSIRDYDEAIRLNPKTAIYFNNRGNAYRNKREYDRAMRDLDKALELDPRGGAALRNRGHVFYARRDYNRAIDDYDEAIRLSPKTALIYSFRGNAYRRKGDKNRALSDYDRALDLDPRNVATLRNRAFVYLAKGDNRRARYDLDEAIRLDPKSAGNFNLRGLAYKQKNELDRAIRDFDEAIRLSPRFALAYANRGDAHRLRNDTERAISDLNEALRLNSKIALAYTSRGLSYQSTGDRDRARKDFKAALALPETGSYFSARWAAKTARAHLTAIEAGASKPTRTEAPSATIETTLAPPASEPEQKGTSGRRVALVLGNGAYKFSAPLDNPTNDAADMARKLRSLGFDVVEGRDLDKYAMESKIREFGRKLDRADLALFFYAGHGLQVADKNYLVPIDARLERPGDLGLDTVTVDNVLAQMESEARVNLVFLDACRDNPLTRSLARAFGARSSSVSKGLAPIESAVGTMIAYATQPKNVALDGRGRNSPFTTALLKHIGTPGLDIGTVMRRVRADVYRSTRKKQLPWDHSSLIGEVVLAR